MLLWVLQVFILQATLRIKSVAACGDASGHLDTRLRTTGVCIASLQGVVVVYLHLQEPTCL